MAEEKDYFGEKLRLAERAREDAYFRKLDQELIAHTRQPHTAEAEESEELDGIFTPILIPVDFSSYSTDALFCAANMAARFASSLIVLHVITKEVETHATRQRLGALRMPLLGPMGAAGPPQAPDEATDEVVIDLRERAYTALQAFLPPQLAKYSVELRVVVGSPFERILETAVREHVGLIVLGTHGRTGLSHALMGSVAERVVRLAPCPVLTVKSQTPENTNRLLRYYETFMSLSS
jgi:nucleotide-binding universal stress UspA family protein